MFLLGSIKRYLIVEKIYKYLSISENNGLRKAKHKIEELNIGNMWNYVENICFVAHRDIANSSAGLAEYPHNVCSPRGLYGSIHLY